MKAMTFNILHCENYITHEIDYPAMANVIKKHGADIVCLNEVYNEGEGSIFENQAKKLSELTGLENYYFAYATYIDEEGPYGNAFLSRIPIVSVENITIPDPEVKTGNELYETRCILKAHLENGITVLATHFGLNRDEHENAVKTVLENLESEKCILMGDLNVEPDNEILKPIQEKLYDAADRVKGSVLSFPSDKPYKKIDYIFTTHDLTVESAEICEDIASDHRAHTAVIK